MPDVLRPRCWSIRISSALTFALVVVSACKGDKSPAKGDAGTDARAMLDARDACPPPAPPTLFTPDDLVDEFGPNAVVSKMASPLARVNIYEANVEIWLTNVELFLWPSQPNTRVTITVAESPSKMMPFTPVLSLMAGVPDCPGFVSTGPLQVLLHPGYYYAIGFDPNQALNYATVAETGSLPVDGFFGRLIGSRTDTSVSLPTLSWDKFTDKEYTRQRLTTQPILAPMPDPVDAAVDQ